MATHWIVPFLVHLLYPTVDGRDPSSIALLFPEIFSGAAMLYQLGVGAEADTEDAIGRDDITIGVDYNPARSLNR